MSKKAPFMASAYGWVYCGFDPVDAEDYALLDAHLRSGGMSIDAVTFDDASLVGRLDPDYTAEIWEKGEAGTAKMGGLGSHTYETQKVCGGRYGRGDVVFKDEDHKDHWHVTPAGERAYGRMEYGSNGRSFHVDEWGQAVSGPRPDTKAHNKLGDNSYKWNAKRGWWVVKRA